MSLSFKGLDITIGADTKQFNREMKAVDRSISETNKQVNELQKSLELEFDAGKFERAQRLTREAIEGTEVKAKALRDQLKHMEDSGTERTNQNYQKLQTELLRTENQAQQLKRKLEEINNIKLENLAKKFENVGAGITKVGQVLTPFSAAATAVLGGFAAIGKSTIDSADKLKTFADRVNMSATELQKWQYIAMQTDVSNDELQAGLVKAQGAFASLAKGDIDVMSKALQNLGFSTQEATMGMGANFDELVKRLAAIQDPLMQAAYANEIFGERMGAKLIPMLKAGGVGIDQLAREFETFGALTEDQIGSLAEFDNTLNKIKFSLKTMRDQIGAALLPLMRTLADTIQQTIIPAVQKIVDWFSNLTLSQQKLLFGTLTFVAALAPVALILGKITSGIGGLVKGIGGIGKALSFLAAHPIIAVIAAVVAMLVYLYNTNEEFKESINSLVKTIGEALTPILDTLMESIKTVLAAVVPLIQAIGNLLVPVVNILVTVLKPLISLISNHFLKILEFIAPAFDFIADAILFVANIINEVLVPVFNKIGEIYAGIFEAIPGVIQKTIKFIESMANTAIDFINKLIREINKLGNVLGFTIGELDRITLNTEIGRPANAQKTPETSTVPGAVRQAVSSTPTSLSPNFVTNNDYSNRDITINVTVENYAQEVDVDDMVRQINIKLAQSL